MNSKEKYCLVRCINRELIIVVLYHPAKTYCCTLRLYLPNSGSQIFLTNCT